METQKYTRPFTIFLLMLPAGISQGFVFVTLPYLLTHNGFSVAQTAAIVALGTSPSLFRFVLGPVVDVSLSLRKWYWISIAAIVVTLLLLSVTPFTVKGAALLSVLVFISQVAVNISFLPIGAFMAKTVEESKKGKASGWYQAGGLAGTGIGGGAGLWIANHFNAPVSGIALSIACLAFALIVLSLRDIEHQTEKTLKQELSGLGKDLLSMIKVPVTLFAIILVLVPIGTGAMANLWSAMAEDWKVDADTVALITGLLSGLISSLGCVAGGYLADRRGIWFAYLGSGVACALVTIIMAVMPMQSTVYIAGVLFYAFTMGMIYAAFTSVVLFAIGNKHVATKFSLMGSIGNIPVVYMTSFDGWMHDQYSSKIMLMAEAIIGITFVILFTIVLRRLKYKKLITV